MSALMDALVFARIADARARSFQMEKYELEDDEEWVPPSEADLKIMRAKRERSDKISQIMGRYLLAGYKMLDSACESCGTILLEDRRKVLYCVACSEVDNEHTKDNPALSGDAAKRQLEEADHKTTTTAELTEFQPVDDEELVVAAAAVLSLSHPNEDVNISTIPKISDAIDSRGAKSSNLDSTWLTKPQDNLKRKIISTAARLNDSRNTTDCIQYCTLIKACVEALHAIQSVAE